ncbi:hypothetical protein EHQ16_00500 [Leptospira kanakyensis]|uniref:Uncharacterized protein n=1 Tax=Leptospira kanakyensis TaxID=2484968 RepID=A0A6N4PX36_9LEPT|nr:hypothetical protein [Leptospira kanakyensis]TGK46131.1 hypothetical protein EHQ11_19490 [Leptospira kanakyensis]TGK65068.1 hypothetical protein EHQ16_00500 [Leptospira kanakyensis]TGK65500.1 hypothetical protein EHQ18_19710 [Leptospira kanakyensis]
MTKKIILFLSYKIGLFVTSFLILHSCSAKDPNSDGSWMVSLLGLISPAVESQTTVEEPGLKPASLYSVDSVSPSVVMENSSFTIEGKNLENVTAKQMFGEWIFKLLKFTEVTNTKITVYVTFCSDKPFQIVPSGSQSGNQQISIPCLGTFRYMPRSLSFLLGMSITPVAPNFSENSLKVLKSLGEVEFVSESNFPEGIYLDKNSGEIKGIPTETTGNEYRFYPIRAELKSNPTLKLQSQVKMIVLTEEEKLNRTCRAFVETSTCRGPSPYRCSNSNICYTNQFACEMDLECGFTE